MGKEITVDTPEDKVRRKVDLDLVKRMAQAGLTTEQMAAIIGYSSRTFDRRIQKNKVLARAIEEGRADALFAVGQTCYQLAVSGDNPGMTAFYLKCRGRWKEVSVVENHNTEQSEVVVVTLPSNGREKAN